MEKEERIERFKQKELKFYSKLMPFPFSREQVELKINKSLEVFLDYDEKIYGKAKNIGYPDILDFPHMTAYINALKPLRDNFIQIVLESLPYLKFKSGVVAFLREAKNKYDGKVIIPIFNDASQNQKWQICDAIAYNPPLNINDWVKDTYLDKRYGYDETGLLPLAIVKMFSKDEARTILKQGFDHHYRVTPEALGKVGTVEDIPFLEEKLLVDYDATHVHKDIEKAIRRIKKRAKVL